ncbi:MULTISPECIES: RNA polymerase sigma factor [Actinomadura]|uniref:RNA polymerase sigma factor n=1 Tax=Actinomadura yumaensis TaxID=111807 RepID=A0ABW2CK02_9ACTN|nr:sigma-70 family RNA polymerase sigma factor [Actinomadura sp. J1-007]MWK37202.1 hypothetical protein [Actinomadura sp. J1-007]
MAGGPGAGGFDDQRLADALRTGDVIALTEVYDTYAPFLYDYCHGLLRDRVEAAGALRNCLISAREHVARLGEPERLRGWLYAVARKECMRRRDSPNRHTGQEAPEADDGLSAEQLARREERRLLAHSALAALNGRQREAIDLAVRHELDAVDLSGIFGVPAEETTRLVAEARDDLADALHAALIAQNHWKDCPSVSALTESWPLSPQTSASLVRHVASCPACGSRETPPLPVDRLLSVLPIAAVPADLRLDVLTAATAEDRADNRRAIAAWTEPFDEYGWPLPYEPASARARDRAPASHRRPILLAVAGGIAVIALIAVSFTAFGGGTGEKTSADGPAPGAGGSGGAPSMESGPSSGRPSDPAPTSASPSPTTTSPTPTKKPTPSKTATRKPSRPHPPAPSKPRPPAPGGLAVAGCDMDVAKRCTVKITAVGGPVDWRVAGVNGDLRAGGGGHLTPGETTGVTVERTNTLCWGEKNGAVSFAPAGAAAVSYC